MDEALERPIWRLLLEKPEALTCDECFAVIDYYFETLGDRPAALLSAIEPYLVKVDPILWTTKRPREMKLLCPRQAGIACKCTSLRVWYDRL